MIYHSYILVGYLVFCCINILLIISKIKNIDKKYALAKAVLKTFGENVVIGDGFDKKTLEKEIAFQEEQDKKAFSFPLILLYVFSGPLFSFITIISTIYIRYRTYKYIKSSMKFVKKYKDLCEEYDEKPVLDDLGINPYSDHAKSLFERKEKENK